MNKQFFVIDTSAILSGKHINIENGKMITTPGVTNEFSPGGKDNRNFEFLLSKGLEVLTPSKESLDTIIKKSKETGDKTRLSNTDVEILALALDIKNNNDNVIILTDDYSIQNLAEALKIEYQSINQKVITKSFKWDFRCPGCNRRFKQSIKICPICGTETKISIYDKDNI